jgi:signal peptidase I
MNSEASSPLSQPEQHPSMSRGNKLLIILALVTAGSISILFTLRVCGMIRPFHVPTGAMTPAVSAGDHVIMEGFTFLSNPPRRGDIVVYKTDGIPSLPPGQFYVKRVVGEPNDRVFISGEKIFINEKEVSLSNTLGRIAYVSPRHVPIPDVQTNITIPPDHYFVVGDNSTNSFDSRYWGTLPRKNIIGRVSYCYSPSHRRGFVQ